MPAAPLDTIPEPPFESEVKRSAPVTLKTAFYSSSAGAVASGTDSGIGIANVSASSAKSSLIADSGGTSVAPRQRPKAQQAQPPLGIQLPIMLPPSPRNTISSPVPPPLQQQQQESQPIAADISPEFNAQFTTAFPPSPLPPQAAAPQALSSAPQAAISTVVVVPGVDQQQQQEIRDVEQPKHIDSLFQTNYPDPFREQPHSEPQNDIAIGITTADVVATTPSGANAVPINNNRDVVVTPLGGGSGSGGHTTPTHIPAAMLGTAKATTHRRNVSDTSAFNK